jgi:hypothetical protein
MSYLESLLAGYRTGLACPETAPLQALREGLSTAGDPEERGRLLASIAASLAGQSKDAPATSGSPAAGRNPAGRSHPTGSGRP